MTGNTRYAPSDLAPGELRLDRLLGRRVLGRNNEVVGRLEEFRAQKRGSGIIVAEFVIGKAGLVERLGVGVRLLIGRYQGHGYIARWDQLDISDADHPRLRCTLEELRKL